MSYDVFIDNKYRRCYVRIIDRARARTNHTQYVERHHIMPRSLGGADDAVNLVSLTYREHFLAHWLLTKFTEGENRLRMKRALWAMSWNSKTHERRITGWRFDVAKKAIRDLGQLVGMMGRGKPKSEEHRRKISDALRGKKKSEAHRAKLRMHSPSPEQRAALSIRMRGRVYSEQTLARMRAANSGRKHTPETRAKLSAALTGRVFTDQWKEKISAKVKGRKIGPHSPEHCARISDASRKRARDRNGRWVPQ
jgi:hypothetical protein